MPASPPSHSSIAPRPPAPGTSGSAGTPGSARRSMRRILWAWAFGATWMYIVMGAAATEYARQLGVSPFGFGVLAALPFIGAFTQLPVSILIERYGGRKFIFMSTGIIGRVLWLPLAAIPWVLPQRYWSVALLTGMSVAMLLTQMGVPAWLSWAADIIPPRVRGRYFSWRIRLGQAVGILVSLAVGLGMDYADTLDPAYVRVAISLAYVFAAVMGVCDYLMHVAVPSPPESPRPDHSIRHLVFTPLADKNFRRFLGFTFTLTFSIGYIGQFVNLYLLDVVVKDLPNKYFVMNVMMVAIPLLCYVLSVGFWGKLIDRFGKRPVAILSGLMTVNGAVAWVFVTPEHWMLGYLVVLLVTTAWPGLDLANFNILLGLSESRGGERIGSAYVAINSVVVAIAGTLSGLFGGAVAESLGADWRIVIFHWPVTYHGVLFLISGVLRAACLFFLIGLHEEGATSTRDAARYMAANIYSNIQQAILMPTRIVGLVGKVSRQTFRMDK
ncbi:MAG: MFS transporter [Phycisphaeraceae bacterium]